MSLSAEAIRTLVWVFEACELPIRLLQRFSLWNHRQPASMPSYGRPTERVLALAASSPSRHLQDRYDRVSCRLLTVRFRQSSASTTTKLSTSRTRRTFAGQVQWRLSLQQPWRYSPILTSSPLFFCHHPHSNNFTSALA